MEPFDRISNIAIVHLAGYLEGEYLRPIYVAKRNKVKVKILGNTFFKNDKFLVSNVPPVYKKETTIEPEVETEAIQNLFPDAYVEPDYEAECESLKIHAVAYFQEGNIRDSFGCMSLAFEKLNPDLSKKYLDLRNSWDQIGSWKDHGIDVDFLRLDKRLHMEYVYDLINILQEEGV